MDAHKGIKIFTGSGGLVLENNWRKSVNRICDLTFRSLLILEYTKGAEN